MPIGAVVFLLRGGEKRMNERRPFFDQNGFDRSAVGERRAHTRVYTCCPCGRSIVQHVRRIHTSAAGSAFTGDNPNVSWGICRAIFTVRRQLVTTELIGRLDSRGTLIPAGIYVCSGEISFSLFFLLSRYTDDLLAAEIYRRRLEPYTVREMRKTLG